MANETAVAKQEQQQKRSLVATLAAQYDMEPQPFLDAIAQTVMPHDRQVSNAMIAAFLMVCNEHHLNPFTREIFAFPTKTGGIQPIVSVDGWVKLVNQHPQFNGMDIAMDIDEKTGKPVSCTCTIYRKDRPEHATPITEYYDECYRNTDPWNKMPKRMMRHKALKEAARYTFGYAGIMDEDEGIDAINVTSESTVIAKETLTKTEALKEKMGAHKAKKEPEKAPEPPAEQVSDSQGQDQGPEPPPPIINDNDLPWDDAPAEAEGEDPERLVTEQERQSILDILKAKVKTTEQLAKVKEESAKKFNEFGAKNSSELKYKHLEAMLEWAKGLEV